MQPENDEFASAFLAAQLAAAGRGKLQEAWGLGEFWKDKVLAHKAGVDKYINPILEDALRKKAEKAAEGIVETKEVTEDDTLLSSLLKVTDGKSAVLHKDGLLNIDDFPCVFLTPQIAKSSTTRF